MIRHDDDEADHDLDVARLYRAVHMTKTVILAMQQLP
jgi:hypothetical protein